MPTEKETLGKLTELVNNILAEIHHLEEHVQSINNPNNSKVQKEESFERFRDSCQLIGELLSMIRGIETLPKTVSDDIRALIDTIKQHIDRLRNSPDDYNAKGTGLKLHFLEDWASAAEKARFRLSEVNKTNQQITPPEQAIEQLHQANISNTFPSSSPKKPAPQTMPSGVTQDTFEQAMRVVDSLFYKLQKQLDTSNTAKDLNFSELLSSQLLTQKFSVKAITSDSQSDNALGEIIQAEFEARREKIRASILAVARGSLSKDARTFFQELASMIKQLDSLYYFSLSSSITQSINSHNDFKNYLKTITDTLALAEQQKDRLNKILEDAGVNLTHIKNHELAGFYQEKYEELKLELYGRCFCKDWKLQWPKIGFQLWFIIFILIDIGFAAATFLISQKAVADWLTFTKGALFSTTVMGLLFWVTRYFNRRIHETIHMMEEYRHRAIMLSLFTPYSERLSNLGGGKQEPLLDFTQKVSSSLTTSPTSALSRKKADYHALHEITEIAKALPIK